MGKCAGGEYAVIAEGSIKSLLDLLNPSLHSIFSPRGMTNINQYDRSMLLDVPFFEIHVVRRPGYVARWVRIGGSGPQDVVDSGYQKNSSPPDTQAVV